MKNVFRHFSSWRTEKLGSNIFAKFSALANEYNAINLGQGFPTFGTPDFVKEAAIDAIRHEQNQYSRPGGHPELVHVLGKMYSKLYNRSIDSLTEIVTFTGAQEGIFSIFAALLNEGDQVVILEPYFDAYINAASMLGIQTVGIPLEFSPERKQSFLDPEDNDSYSSAELILDLEKLEQAITPETKMLVLNTPHNPTGKVFSKAELTGICELMQRHPQVLILSDEVYEFMTFEAKHERIATFPDMYHRVISLFSAGKTFSCTGWRVGYCICPPHLADPILRVHNAVPFCGVVPMEVAVAKAFTQCETNDYLNQLSTTLQEKRDLMLKYLSHSKLKPIVPQGGYFVCCESRFLANYPDTSLPDYQMALTLCQENGIATIPTSPFYSTPNKAYAGGKIRLAYCKDKGTLEAAGNILVDL